MPTQLFNGNIPLNDNRAETIYNFILNELKDIVEISECESIAFILMEEYAGIRKNVYHLSKDLRLTESEIIKIYNAVARLKKHEPIDYVLGFTPFYHQKFSVTSDVLIPRPETEEMVELIINENKNQFVNPRILDIGTGSGCIAITLAMYFPTNFVMAIDTSSKALDVAKENALKMHQNVSFMQLDILDENQWENLPEFNIIVSNPPYISISEKDSLNANVVNYEPHDALFVSDNHPLIFYEMIARLGKLKLFKDGVIYVEINQKFGDKTLDLFKSFDYKNVKLLKDLSGNDRFVKAEHN